VERGVQLGPLGTAATDRPIVSAPGDYDDGKICGIIGRGNRSTRRKTTPVPLCPPQTPHAARTQNRAAGVGSQRLTAVSQYGSILYNWCPLLRANTYICKVTVNLHYKVIMKLITSSHNLKVKYKKYLFHNIWVI
jgi:hypothetical protein